MRIPILCIPRGAGFTLIELMVTIVIATILITIAVPSYMNQIRQAHRTDAKTALLDLAQREERYLSTNSSYTTNPANLGYSGAAFPVNVGSNYYQLTVCVSATLPCTGNATTGAAYLLTATAINTQAKDTQCLNLYVDNTGNQTATSTNCWTN
ncbi:MAG: type IV pilin protein [Steroidobacteraceae bacterium]